MTVEELIIYGKKYVHSDYVKILLADLLNLNPLELLMHLNDKVEKEKCDIFKKEIEALETGKPIQYILGHVNFYGNQFEVNENVLIPRFETEELVENVIKYVGELFKKEIRILDLCCGSGVIGLTLKQKIPNSKVDLADISTKALDVTKKNSMNLGLGVNIIESDLFSKINQKYDVIVSNPPYIRENENIEQIVKENEPHIALYGGTDGLDYYRRILKEIKNYMNTPCLVAFEIGSSQKEEITKIINQELTNVVVTTKKDLSSRDRMIFILKNE